MINLTNRSFSAFYHNNGGLVYQDNTIEVPLHDSITNQVEKISVQPKELAEIIAEPQVTENNLVKLWDAGILNGGFPKELHRNLMFDAHSFVLDPFPSSETIVEFSFKMLFGFINNDLKNKSKELREEHRDDYVQIEARLIRHYSPYVTYKGILSQPFAHTYFGGMICALDFLTYAILNNSSISELNVHFKPLSIPTICDLPLVKQAFSVDKTQTFETLITPYSQLSVVF